MDMKYTFSLTALLLAPLAGLTAAEKSTPIEPTWESMAANYRCPDWFQDGKIGVWTHWGIPSAIDENRPNDGSHYGRRMYGTEGYLGGSDKDIEMTRVLSEWHS